MKRLGVFPLCAAILLSFTQTVRGDQTVEAKRGTEEDGEDPATPTPPQQTPDTPDREAPPVNAVLGNLGFDLSTPDGNYRMHLWFRVQMRYSYPFGNAPLTVAEPTEPSQSSFTINRARLKLGGNVYRSWLDYYLEYDFVTPTLLDARFTLKAIPWLGLRVGQWKVLYNRERVDSSGKQQFVERSIVNPFFTIDRQPGVMLIGHFFDHKPLLDSWYMLGVFNGNGRGATNDDSEMMWVGRYQLQLFGRALPASQSDLEYHRSPAASLAFGGLHNRSPFTRFSTRGGGQLPGFEEGEPGQYELRQFLVGTAAKYRGFSWQQEYHRKAIEDRLEGGTTELEGLYAQAGYLPWRARRGGEHPLKPLELAIRYAWVDPDRELEGDEQTEVTFAVNWFFAGHDNKLTADLSRLRFERGRMDPLEDTRLRFQWDISF